MLALPSGAKLLVPRQTQLEVRCVIDIFAPSGRLELRSHLNRPPRGKENKVDFDTNCRACAVEHWQRCIVDNIVDENKMNSAANSRARRVGV